MKYFLLLLSICSFLQGEQEPNTRVIELGKKIAHAFRDRDIKRLRALRVQTAKLYEDQLIKDSDISSVINISNQLFKPFTFPKMMAALSVITATNAGFGAVCMVPIIGLKKLAKINYPSKSIVFCGAAAGGLFGLHNSYFFSEEHKKRTEIFYFMKTWRKIPQECE